MIPGVVLAAGESRRMGGRAKALLPIGTTTFVARIVDTLRAGGVEDVLVVLGAGADDIAPEVERLDPPPRIIENREWRRGQLSSVLAALAVVDRPAVRGMLLTLVDVPLVQPATVRAVLEAWRRTGAPVVRPSRRGRHGHPVLFDRQVFDALRRTDPAAGARAVVHAVAGALVDVEVDDEGAFVDIDTPDAYRRFIRPDGPGDP